MIVIPDLLFFTQGSAMIDIVSVRRSDAGRYTCVADSGADRATDILELVGKSPSKNSVLIHSLLPFLVAEPGDANHKGNTNLLCGQFPLKTVWNWRISGREGGTFCPPPPIRQEFRPQFIQVFKCR